MKLTKKNALIMKRATAILGGQAKAAKYFQRSQGTLSNYIRMSRPVPIGTILMAETVIREDSQ